MAQTAGLIIIFIITSVLSALIGIAVGVVFQRRVERAWNALRRWWILRVRSAVLEPPPPESFSLGSRQFPFLVVDGDGVLTYQPATIRTLIDGSSSTLPPEVQARKERVASDQAEKKAQGLPHHWNGPLYSLKRYAIARTIPDEQLSISLTFRTSDYYSFLSTVMSLDENLLSAPAQLTLRQRYLLGQDVSNPVEFLAQGFGVALVAISSDDKMILGYRSADSGARPSELDITVVEGVHPVLDRASDHPGPDLYRTAIRGASEEAGLDVYEHQVHFLGFGVDTEWYQWALLGAIDLDSTADEALEGRRRGTGGKWEVRRFRVLSADPPIVFQFLNTERLWALGWVVIYWALVRRYGRRVVDAAAKAVLKGAG